MQACKRIADKVSCVDGRGALWHFAKYMMRREGAGGGKGRED